MQKKSLDSNIGVNDYNKKLFTKAMELISSCKKVPIGEVSNLHRQQGVKNKYNAIDEKLQNVLKILRNFTDTEKPAFNNPIDLAAEILEETKLQVEIQFRKANEEKNTVKVLKNDMANKKQRPQSRYPNIKIYENFDQHLHQSYLQDGLISQIKPCTEVKQPTGMTTEYSYIDTPQKLNNAIKQMKEYKEIAVDVEHSGKSYEGFTCLIQMSTRNRDYIIDVLPIWDSVPALQEVIGDPNILKVMHGAEMDTKWLQRDFNIHIVNLFDTYRAARVLGMAKLSYAFLLSHYCGVNTNKIYQRADWRERPLNAQMLKYARMDTHYLLTIFDYLRMDLQKQSSLIVNISLRDVFKDIQKSSHQVTLANVELFSYKTREMYRNLQIQFQDKRQEFQAINSIFSEINYIAMREDENFDDLIGNNELSMAISLVKDLTYNQKSKISKQARIQKIISSLQKAGHQCLNQAIVNIKSTLLRIFCQHRPQITVQAPVQPRPAQQQKQKRSQTVIQTPQQTEPEFTRIKNANLKFHELPYRSFNPPNTGAKKIVLNFMPITSFLSAKYGIEEIKQEDNVMEEESAQIQEEIEEEQMNMEAEAQKEGVIEFKRMNPNVIYTIEQPDPEITTALNSQKPRKARKETEYQNRIRSQKGNIYDLLDHN